MKYLTNLYKSKNIPQFFVLGLFFSSLLLIVIHFISLSIGYYFTGDTISSLEPAIPGKPGNFLIVFLYYYAVWPPAVGFAFSLLKGLPISFISQHHVYVFALSILSLGITYLITSKITESKILRIILVALILFSGTHQFLLNVAISEPMFIFFWLLTLFSIERFMSTMRERYILLFLAAAWGMTITRYSGLSILASLIAVILIFAFYTYKQKKYSLSLIFITIIFVWVPIGVYLLRNKIMGPLLFGLHDRQFDYVTLADIFRLLLPDLFLDLTLLLVICFFIGLKITWNKSVKYYLFLSGVSGLTYVFFLFYGLLTYRFQSGFHSRLSAISYPELILATLCLGSFLSFKFPRLKKLAFIGFIAGLILTVFQSHIILQRLILDHNNEKSAVSGTEYSQDIRGICLGKRPNKFLLLQDTSRNWVGQSLHFYCQPIKTVDVKSLPYTFPKDSLIYSGYELNNSKLYLEKFYQGEKKIYIYKTLSEVKLEKTGKLNNLEWLD